MRSMKFQDDDNTMWPNEGFVQRLWESDPNVIYVESLCSRSITISVINNTAMHWSTGRNVLERRKRQQMDYALDCNLYAKYQFM